MKARKCKFCGRTLRGKYSYCYVCRAEEKKEFSKKYHPSDAFPTGYNL